MTHARLHSKSVQSQQSLSPGSLSFIYLLHSVPSREGLDREKQAEQVTMMTSKNKKINKQSSSTEHPD